MVYAGPERHYSISLELLTRGGACLIDTNVPERRTTSGDTLLSGGTMPVVAVSCSLIIPEAGAPSHAVFEPYLTALARYAAVLPLLVPAALPGGDGEMERRTLLQCVDGVLLTGSRSMVAPDKYGGSPSEPGTLHDHARDSRTLPLVKEAIEAGVPVFGICRGAQEINCALGGTLYQAVHDLPGCHDHRALRGAVEEGDKYLPRHRISLTKGGWLEKVARNAGLGEGSGVFVSTLHEQAVDRLGAGIVVEAVADDGIVEAIRVAAARSFAVGVQWHPEWHLEEQPLNRRLYAMFGDACRERFARRPKSCHPAEIRGPSKLKARP